MNAGTQLKLAGLNQVADNNEDWLFRVRNVARKVSASQGHVSSDELRTWTDLANDHPLHQNAWGAVFKGKGWKLVGRKQSTYKSNRAREIRVWRWEG